MGLGSWAALPPARPPLRRGAGRPARPACVAKFTVVLGSARSAVPPRGERGAATGGTRAGWRTTVGTLMALRQCKTL